MGRSTDTLARISTLIGNQNKRTVHIPGSPDILQAQCACPLGPRPHTAGIYQGNTRVAFSAAAGQTAGILINVNGIDLDATYDDEVGAASAWAKPRINRAIKLNAGDAVKIRGKASVNGLYVYDQSDFQMFKIAGF